MYCCCCPLYVGIWILTLLVFFITIFYTIDAIVLFFNVYVDIYYPAVLLIVLIPLFFAFGIFILYSEDSTKEGRGRLKIGIILVIFSVVLIALWTLYYYLVLYKYKEVYNGNGDKDDPDNNYHKESKKTLIVITLIKTLSIIVIFTHAWFEVTEWAEIGEDPPESTN